MKAGSSGDDTTGRFGPAACLGWAAAAILLIASLSRGVLSHVALQYPLQTLACLAAGAVLVYLPALAGLRHTLHRLLFASNRRNFNTVLFCTAALLYIAGTWILFEGLPRLDDSVAAVFQSRILASGHWLVPAPEPGDFFRQFGNIDAYWGYPHLCSMYPPGHPVVLVPGVMLGAPWLVNPLLGAGLAVLVAELGRQLFGRATGRLAGVFALLSPFVGVMAGTHLSHIPTAFFCTLCMWAVVRLLRTRRWIFGPLAGFGFGMAFLCRPLTALVIGVVIGWAPLWYWRRALRRWKAVVAALVLSAAAAGGLMAYQQMATGDFRTPGHKVGLGRRAKYGFVKIDWVRTHTVAVGVEHTTLRMQALNEKVLGWPIPLFAVALLPFFLGRARKEDVWLLLPSLGLLLVFMAYWYQEYYFPARYIFAGAPMLLVMAARGCTAATSVLKVRGPRSGRLIPALVSGCVLFNLFVFIPEHTRAFGGTFGDVESVLPRMLREIELPRSLLFIEALGRGPDDGNPSNDFYGTGFMRNTLDFDGDILFVRNLRERNIELASRHPDRSYYLYQYRRDRDKGYLYRLVFDGEDQRTTLIASCTGEGTMVFAQDPQDGPPRKEP